MTRSVKQTKVIYVSQYNCTTHIESAHQNKSTHALPDKNIISWNDDIVEMEVASVAASVAQFTRN